MKNTYYDLLICCLEWLIIVVRRRFCFFIISKLEHSSLKGAVLIILNFYICLSVGPLHCVFKISPSTCPPVKRRQLFLLNIIWECLVEKQVWTVLSGCEGQGALTGVPGAPETAQGSWSSVGLQRMPDVVVSYSVSFHATSREDRIVCRGPHGAARGPLQAGTNIYSVNYCWRWGWNPRAGFSSGRNSL